MIVRKTVRRNEFGAYDFAPNLETEIVGKTVEIRDWYGDVRGRILSVMIGEAGYPCAVEMDHESGKHIPAFSLHSTREIEILS